MALAFSFQLTPRQTELLLICVYGHYREMGVLTYGEPPSYLPDFQDASFVSVGNKLIQKGLLTHSNSQSPTWQPTERGRHLAEMIVGDARRMVALADTAKPLPVKPDAKSVKGKKC